MAFQTCGYAAFSVDKPLAPLTFERRALRDDDVHVSIKYCGLCHSDVHYLKGHYGPLPAPVVAGHEIAGVVARVGPKVTKFKVGDRVGVGCYSDSCGSCEYCVDKDEDLCDELVTPFSPKDRHGEKVNGGFSRDIVVKEKFVLRIPDGLELTQAAPLLCAGVTVYSVLSTWGFTKAENKKRVGVMGLGGLGHLAVPFALALGHEVVVLSRSDAKKEEALKELHATDFINTSEPSEMQRAAGTMHLLIDTTSPDKDVDPYLALLKKRGAMVNVGTASGIPKARMSAMPMLVKGLIYAGCKVGNMKAHEEMLALAAGKGVKAMIEVLPITEINTAIERLEKGDVRYRFVFDVENSCPKAA